MSAREGGQLAGHEIMEWASAQEVAAFYEGLDLTEAEVAVSAISATRVQTVRDALFEELIRREGIMADEKLEITHRLDNLSSQLEEVITLGSLVMGYEKHEQRLLRLTPLSNLPPAVLALGSCNTPEERQERSDKLKAEVMCRAPSIDTKVSAARVANALIHERYLSSDYFEYAHETIYFKGTGSEEPDIKQIFAYSRLIGEKIGRGIFEVFGSLGREQADQAATSTD